MWLSGFATLALALQLCQAPKDIAFEPEIIGLAGGDSRETLQYCEWHSPLKEDKQTIVYASPEGQVLAISELDFASGPATPSFTQQDYRSGELRSVVLEGNQWQLRYRAQNGAKLQQKAIAAGEVGVVGPGFVAAITDHWQALQTGQPIEFAFASSVFQRTIDLRVQKKSAQDCGAPETSGEHCFWVQPHNPFLRWFTDRLELTFDNRERLVVYFGTVNLQADNGKSQQLRIHYLYLD